MNDSAPSAPKQQIVDQIKKSKHILLTVPKNPTVDELSAAVGLSLLLDKLEKRPTIAFSGKVPPAISFLEPDKLITQDIDGLRDFIIALDKEKADKLRWKVEDDIVKIYVTPYKTSLGEEDLKFEQGEFNIELIIALGVESSDTLDEAIASHNRILHDAPVVTVNAGNKKSDVGSINWQDSSASSVSGMIVTIGEALGSNLLDKQMATAFLTGLVANTNRFSNELTTPRVMTMSAKLMSLGANQQLIASHLGSPQVLDENDEASIKKAFQMPKDKPDEVSDSAGNDTEDNISNMAAKDGEPSVESKTDDKVKGQSQEKSAEESSGIKPSEEKPDTNSAELVDISPNQNNIESQPQAPQNSGDQIQKPPAMPPFTEGRDNAPNKEVPSQQPTSSPSLSSVSEQSQASANPRMPQRPLPQADRPSQSVPVMAQNPVSPLVDSQLNQPPSSGGDPVLPSIEPVPGVVDPSEGVDDARKAVEDAMSNVYSKPASESSPNAVAPSQFDSQPLNNMPPMTPNTSPDVNNHSPTGDLSSQLPPQSPSGLMMPPELPPLPDTTGAGFDALPPLPSMPSSAPPATATPSSQSQNSPQSASLVDKPPQGMPSSDDPDTFPLPPYA